MISPLARPAAPMKTRRKRAADNKLVPLEARPPGLVGLCVHTTGSGIVERAVFAGQSVTEACVEYYLLPESYFPTYVCGWRGWRSMDLVAICDEDKIALHVGYTTGEAVLYSEGTWRQKIDPKYWDRAWRPEFHSPPRLYPKSTPNRAFIGLELPPLREPRDNGLRYTDEQHETVAELAADLFARHGLAPARRRVVGHEDVNPIPRWGAGGGWDPGARRERPWFDWDTVYRRLGLLPEPLHNA